MFLWINVFKSSPHCVNKWWNHIEFSKICALKTEIIIFLVHSRLSTTGLTQEWKTGAMSNPLTSAYINTGVCVCVLKMSNSGKHKDKENKISISVALSKHIDSVCSLTAAQTHSLCLQVGLKPSAVNRMECPPHPHHPTHTHTHRPPDSSWLCVFVCFSAGDWAVGPDPRERCQNREKH